MGNFPIPPCNNEHGSSAHSILELSEAHPSAGDLGLLLIRFRGPDTSVTSHVPRRKLYYPEKAEAERKRDFALEQWIFADQE